MNEWSDTGLSFPSRQSVNDGIEGTDIPESCLS